MTGRMRRVNEALREVLSEGIGSLKDPRIGFVTVTGVDTSPDLHQATVYVSVLGSAEEARRHPRRPAVLARRPPEPREPRAPSEANPTIDV